MTDGPTVQYTLQFILSVVMLDMRANDAHKMALVMRRLSNRNRKSNTLATIECDRNRDISRAKCDFDHTLFSGAAQFP